MEGKFYLPPSFHLLGKNGIWEFEGAKVLVYRL